MLKTLATRELARLAQQPLRWASLLVYALLVTWSVASGVGWKHELERSHQARIEQFDDRATWMADLAKVESGENSSPTAAHPMNLKLLALAPAGPLSQLAFRHEGHQPRMAEISGWRSDASLFRRYEISGPTPPSVGRLDLSHCVLVIMPLVLLLLTFDVLSAERESGRLRLLLVQGAGLSALVWTRVLIVAALLWMISMAGVGYAALAFGAGALEGARLGLYCLALTTYTLFWAAAAAWVASGPKRVVDTAFAALSTWAAVVILVPSFVQFAAEVESPIPSRVAYHHQARAAEAEARRELDQRTRAYLADHHVEHVELDERVPAFYRATYLANLGVNAATDPLAAAFDERRAAQVSYVEGAQMASPTTLALRSFELAAGVGTERAADFRNQVRGHLRKVQAVVGPATVQQIRLSSKEARSVPEFSFREPELGSRAWLAPFWTLLLGFATAVAAWYSTQRMSEGRTTD